MWISTFLFYSELGFRPRGSSTAKLNKILFSPSCCKDKLHQSARGEKINNPFCRVLGDGLKSLLDLKRKNSFLQLKWWNCWESDSPPDPGTRSSRVSPCGDTGKRQQSSEREVLRATGSPQNAARWEPVVFSFLHDLFHIYFFPQLNFMSTALHYGLTPPPPLYLQCINSKTSHFQRPLSLRLWEKSVWRPPWHLDSLWRWLCLLLSPAGT